MCKKLFLSNFAVYSLFLRQFFLRCSFVVPSFFLSARKN